mmetsp:Transcript_12695/g.22814  ORF Transcript_12695/g.22814 Transcript_12695/m.22814 type:complete len:82 (-) Transcript_12695:1189-1434(-)
MTTTSPYSKAITMVIINNTYQNKTNDNSSVDRSSAIYPPTDYTPTAPTSTTVVKSEKSYITPKHTDYGEDSMERDNHYHIL